MSSNVSERVVRHRYCNSSSRHSLRYDVVQRKGGFVICFMLQIGRKPEQNISSKARAGACLFAQPGVQMCPAPGVMGVQVVREEPPFGATALQDNCFFLASLLVQQKRKEDGEGACSQMSRVTGKSECRSFITQHNAHVQKVRKKASSDVATFFFLSFFSSPLYPENPFKT